jgi:hypothetical protein
MIRFAAALTVVAFAAFAVSGLTLGALIGSPSEAMTRSQASSVAREFFTSLNRRHYEQTCDLLSHRYLEAQRLESASKCSLGLRIGFMWSQEIRFRIERVRLRSGRAFVEAVVDGSPGELVLAREGAGLIVLAVRGG